MASWRQSAAFNGGQNSRCERGCVLPDLENCLFLQFSIETLNAQPKTQAL